jgi:aerobic carbon-monoxide dehydrogenase medium subunit
MTTGAAVLVPSTQEEAAEAFGDGGDVTVIGGGTIVMSDLKAGRIAPGKALLLTKAGLDGVSENGRTYSIGATTPVGALIGATPEPLSTFASYVGDYEIRGQGTVGGNLCASAGPESPRGDLQAALLALGARVRSAGAGGERTDTVDDFLSGDESRLVLGIEVDEPKRAAAAALGRPHAHSYTVMAVAAAETSDGVRVAVAGAGPHATRLVSVEQALASGSSPADAAAKAGNDAAPVDDALASAWYRSKMLPVLVERALNAL